MGHWPGTPGVEFTGHGLPGTASEHTSNMMAGGGSGAESLARSAGSRVEAAAASLDS
jgi:hypothetical protein